MKLKVSDTDTFIRDVSDWSNILNGPARLACINASADAGQARDHCTRGESSIHVEHSVTCRRGRRTTSTTTLISRESMESSTNYFYS